MRLVSIALATAIALTPIPLFANGGTFSTSAVQRTGDLVPLKKEAITLQREVLNIRFKEDDAFVQVSYDLLNHGPADTVTFGFPVDLVTEKTLFAPNGYDYVLGKSLGDVRVRDNNQPVPVERVIDKPLERGERPDGIDPRLELFRRWSVMPLRFEAGERKHLTVSYRVRCFGVDHGFEGDWDWKFGQRIFFYTFQPAVTWGDGRVRELAVSLDLTWLGERGIPITDMSPGGESDGRGVIRWSIKDCVLGTLPDLALWYNPAECYRQDAISRSLVPTPALKGLVVSSALRSSGANQYSKASMLDGNLKTSWVEGAKGPGVGESIVYVPEKVSLASIGFLNGYWASEYFYYANSRIKKLRVELDVGGKDVEPKDRHRVLEVDLPQR